MSQSFNPDTVEACVWLRLIINCTRVRAYIGSPIEGRRGVAASSISQILPYLPSNSLFPRLLYLSVFGPHWSPLFMSPSIRTFSWLVGSTPALPQPFVSDIAEVVTHVMPSLTSITIIGASFLERYQVDIARILSGFTHLRTVCLPRYALSQPIFDSLATLQELEEVTPNPFVHGWEKLLVGERETVLGFSIANLHPPTHVPPFASIRFLHLTLPDVSVGRYVFGDPYFSARSLETLELFFIYPGADTASDVGGFLERLSRSCPGLQQLVFSMVARLEVSAHVAFVEPITISALVQLLLFKELTHCHVEHTLPLDISDDDMDVLSTGMPRLRYLSLNRHPAVLYPSQLTLNSLATFARHCPKLEFLGLYLNSLIPVDASSAISFGPSFGIFNVGASIFPSRGTCDGWWLIGEYLAMALHDRCSLNTSIHEDLADAVDWTLGVRGGLVRVPQSLLAQYDDGWKSAEVMARQFRSWARTGCYVIGL